jgi:hypothetical protein
MDIFRCTFCSAAVDEDESAGPQHDSRLLLARFNTQMEKLFDLLHAVENIRYFITQSLFGKSLTTFCNSKLNKSISENVTLT